ncbi:spo7-like protein [Sarocladium implicatum]|nr:spo7-like protein [Sarocladium implicatum]
MPSDLDSLVKGAASPAAEHVNLKSSSGTTPVDTAAVEEKQGDPLSHTPSSPTMIYLNLLILEASMRAQFLELRARKRHHTFFLALLALWIAFFTYALFLAPREDGRGVGGSIYWAVEGAEKVCFMGGIITAILVWAAGIWERGIRWPRRWFAVSNRGLRGFNCKLVIIRRPLWAEALSTIAFFLTYGLFSHTASSSYRVVDPSLLREVEKELQLTGDNHPTLVLPPDDEEGGGHEEDLAPGGDYVKLLLLAKPFSATFRENWELYRTEYWERENERRALLRKKVKDHDRRMAKEQLGWFWWLPGRRVRHPRSNLPKGHVPHRPLPPHHHLSGERKRRSSSVRRGSTSSSRSQTPILEGFTEENTGAGSAPVSRKPSSASDKRRKKGSISAASVKGKRPGTESRSVTPDIPSPLARGTNAEPEEGGPHRVTRSSSRAASVASQ